MQHCFLLFRKSLRFLGSAMGIAIANRKNRCDFGALSNQGYDLCKQEGPNKVTEIGRNWKGPSKWDKPVSAKICSVLRLSAKICGFLQKSALPTCCNAQEKQQSAKICKNLQKRTASLAPFVPFRLSLSFPLEKKWLKSEFGADPSVPPRRHPKKKQGYITPPKRGTTLPQRKRRLWASPNIKAFRLHPPVDHCRGYWGPPPLPLPQYPPKLRPCGGVKQCRLVILRFLLIYNVLGSQDTQVLGKTAWKTSLPDPFLCAHQMLVKLGFESSVPKC